MMHASAFNLKQFFRELNIPKAEHADVEKCLARGVKRYYRELYGYDKYGSRPDFMVAERMGEPYIFGYGAVEIVRRASLSLETRLKVVQYALQQIRPLEEYGTPHGLPALLSFLAGVGALQEQHFRSVMQIVNIEIRFLFDDWPVDEVRALTDWVILKADMPDAERLWWLWHIIIHCEKHQTGKLLLDHWLQHDQLSTELKHDLCHALLADESAGEPPAEWKAVEAGLRGDQDTLAEALSELGRSETPLPLESLQEAEAFVPSYGFIRSLLGGGFVLTPAYLKRKALQALPELGADPLALCQTYLGSERSDYYANAVNQGVADIIWEYRTAMPEAVVRELVERGLGIGKVATRKAFYRLGAELFGPEYWTRAQSDNAESIRTWAAKQAAGGASGGRKRKRNKPAPSL